MTISPSRRALLAGLLSSAALSRAASAQVGPTPAEESRPARSARREGEIVMVSRRIGRGS
jgi:hypothetical protein